MSIHIRWHAPQRNWYKLNTDGAYKTNSKGTGLGGVFRDHAGNWILGFQKKIVLLHHRYMLNYRQYTRAYNIVPKFKLFPIEAETDSTAIIAIYHDHIIFSNIVYACRSLMPQQKLLLLRHNIREGN